MAYRPELHDHSSDEAAGHEVKAKEFLSDTGKKQVKAAIEDIVNEEFDRLEENAAYFLTQTAAQRAENYIDAVLRGEEKACDRLFGSTCQASRYKGSGHDSGEPWASDIHGRVFETDGIKMRRMIVEAHPELIRNERIKDLESIVEGLQKQIAGLNQQLNNQHRNDY